MKYLKVGVVVLVALMFAGCSAMERRNFAEDTSALSSEPLSILTRPYEIGLEPIGQASGTASSARVLGFLVDGDNVTIPVFGLGRDDPMVRLAAYRAATQAGGDAFYVTRVESDATGAAFIYQRRKVTVHGRVFRIDELGQVEQKRADELRKSGTIQKSSGGLFGLFGD